MVNNQVIEDVKNKLIEVYEPLKIYLCDSYAWGVPDEFSDLDLLVIVDGYKRIPAIYRCGSAKKEEFDRKAENRATYYKIKQRGKRIYARA